MSDIEEQPSIPLHDLGYADDPNGDGPGIPDVPSSGYVGDDPETSEETYAGQVPAQAGGEE